MTKEEFVHVQCGDRIRVARADGFDEHSRLVKQLMGQMFTVHTMASYNNSNGTERNYVSCKLTDEQKTFIQSAQNSPWRYALVDFYIEQIDLVSDKDPHFPHDCPRCKGPAYFGAVPAAFECKRKCKP